MGRKLCQQILDNSFDYEAEEKKLKSILEDRRKFYLLGGPMNI